MAKAPRPGVGARMDEARGAEQLLVLRIGEERWTLGWQNLPMGERMLVRKWTGLPYSAFYQGSETIDADSLALLWCLARRAQGEASLVFNDALVVEWNDRLEAADGDFDASIEMPDDEADDPEA